jgi:hypothetical protein
MEDNYSVYNMAQSIATASLLVSSIMAIYTFKTAAAAPLTNGTALVPAAVEAIVALAAFALAGAAALLGDQQLNVAGRAEGRSIDKVVSAAEAWGAVSPRVGDGAKYPR